MENHITFLSFYFLFFFWTFFHLLSTFHNLHSQSYNTNDTWRKMVPHINISVVQMQWLCRVCLIVGSNGSFSNSWDTHGIPIFPACLAMLLSVAAPSQFDPSQAFPVNREELLPTKICIQVFWKQKRKEKRNCGWLHRLTFPDLRTRPSRRSIM